MPNNDHPYVVEDQRRQALEDMGKHYEDYTNLVHDIDAAYEQRDFSQVSKFEQLQDEAKRQGDVCRSKVCTSHTCGH